MPTENRRQTEEVRTFVLLQESGLTPEQAALQLIERDRAQTPLTDEEERQFQEAMKQRQRNMARH